jgi:hypothetical protein
MIKINQAFIQTMFAGNGGTPQIIGGAVTVNGNNFSIAKGFVYFGESTDETYITRTGTNQLCAVILPASYTLVNVNCYIYVNYVITYSPSNRTATITANVYSSVNPTDSGIKICDIVNSVPTNYVNNNITNYFAIGSNNTLVLTDPSGNTSSLITKNLQATGNIESIGNISSQGTGNFGSNNQGGTNSLTTLSKTKAGYTAVVGTSDNPIGASVLVGNGTIRGSTGLYLTNSGGLDYVDISNNTTIGDGTSANAGRAYYAKQGMGLYPAVSNLVQKFNPASSYTSTSGIQTYPDANGNYVTDIINDKEGQTCGIQMDWNPGLGYWNRPQLVGTLSQQWISADPSNHPTPNAIYTWGDFRNGLICLELGHLTFLMIRASWQGELWYCTLNGCIQLYPGTGDPANTKYSYDINLYNMFGISGIRPNDSPHPFIGVASRIVFGPIQQDILGGAGVKITDATDPNIITPFLQFSNVPGTPNMNASFICQFNCTTIGNF